MDFNLLLNDNSFNGRIPPQIFSLTKMENNLMLHGNRLCGEIPSTIGQMTSLATYGYLSLHDNQLCGELPAELLDFRQSDYTKQSRKAWNIMAGNELNTTCPANNGCDWAPPAPAPNPATQPAAIAGYVVGGLLLLALGIFAVLRVYYPEKIGFLGTCNPMERCTGSGAVNQSSAADEKSNALLGDYKAPLEAAVAVPARMPRTSNHATAPAREPEDGSV
jgi:hypothetical protein